MWVRISPPSPSHPSLHPITNTPPLNSSISIACWIVVFTPQIHSNFRRRSADGLSLLFIIVWLIGDIFNIIGAVLQKVLPTMIILAVYYTLADLVLLAQCLWYRRRAEGGDERVIEEEEEEVEEEDTRPLLQREPESPRKYSAVDADGRGRVKKGSRNGSFSSLQARLAGLDASHLSRSSPYAGSRRPSQATTGQKPTKLEEPAPSTAAAVLSNVSALALVTLAGVLGWYLSSRSHQFPDEDDEDHHVDPISSSSFSVFTTTTTFSTSSSTTTPLNFSLWGQIFGYLCAILYLLSRLPQILLNARRKSIEGLSTLFFLFACLGNITYVASIFAYEPPCASSTPFSSTSAFKNHGVSGGGGIGRLSEGFSRGCEAGEWRKGYTRYVLVNLSWILGSAGTLLLDFTVLAQFWVYRGRKPREEIGSL